MPSPTKRKGKAAEPGVSRDVAEQLLDAPVDQSADAMATSDSEILDDIRACLEQTEFDTSDVRVQIHSGAVHVEGRVDSDEARTDILDVIGGCAGALVTVSRLRVGR
ncbi:MAG: BON domain-containing protein [Nevskia sp.]|nr:BON domain-containing protein [Nevskia sp.]